MLALILLLLASFGAIALGLRYVLATPPLGYHAEIIRDEPPGPATLSVLGALYGVLGGGYLASGVMFLMLTLFGVWNDLLWAKLTILAGALLAGYFATMIPLKMETATGVKTPWRLSAGLTALMVIAVVLSLL